MRDRLGREYFEDLYSNSTDPWNFESSEYERVKYARTLELLGNRRFGRALEAGSSIGVFTKMLADRCDELVAVDVSEKAVAVARERLRGVANVKIERRTLPEEMPSGSFDLIVASEILYYFTRPEMLATLERFEDSLAPGGVLVAVHWRRETRRYPLQGDEVHELLLQNSRLKKTASVIEADYWIDRLEDAQ